MNFDLVQIAGITAAAASLIGGVGGFFITGHKALLETIKALRAEIKENSEELKASRARERDSLREADEERERAQEANDALRKMRNEMTNVSHEVTALCDTIVVARDALTNLLNDTDLPSKDMRQALRKICNRLTTARK